MLDLSGNEGLVLFAPVFEDGVFLGEGGLERVELVLHGFELFF